MNDLAQAIKTFSEKRVLVLGDIMLDKYVKGEVERISPEAPVPILKKIREEYSLGGAANVAHNVISLGAKAILVGVVGDDKEKEIIFRLLQENTITDGGIITDTTRPTIVKERFITGHGQAFRVDQECTDHLSEPLEDDVIAALETLVPEVDGIILSDYAKGIFSERLTKLVIQLGKKYKKQIFADIKPRGKNYFKGVDLVTPNFKEGEEMTGLTTPEAIAQALAVELGCTVFLTLGKDGLMVAETPGECTQYPTRKVKVYDVSGAGDTVIAVAALAFLSGLSTSSVARLSNYAGEVVVQKPGTATVSPEELLALVNDDHHVESVPVVPKVWGYEKWLENNDNFCSKILSINKGYQCSLHYHKIKDEMFLVTKGHVRVELDDELLYLRPGNFIHVLPEMKHRFRGLEDSEMVEISTHHDEADSYRIEESRKVEDGEK
jgi:D-beta-D-heptose 7-phosphate kinase/D-beta-D-heptose 1-phosphate adenosyltransferase